MTRRRAVMRPHIVSLGDMVVDLIFPITFPLTPGEHQDIKGRKIEPGGACNFMIAAQRIGAQVSAVGAVGSDAFGAELLTILQAEGIDTSAVDAAPGAATTLVLVLTDPLTHQHMFVGSYGEGKQAAYTDTVDAIIQRADAVLVQGYTLYEKRVAGMAIETINRAKSYGKLICLDAGPSLHIVDADMIDWAITKSDIVLMTEDEIAGASGNRRGEAAFQHLFRMGAQTLVIKQGGRGCTVIQEKGREYVEAFAVPVVDSVGAGDCFDAGFITAYLNGHTLRECALMANAMGAANVQKLGAGRSVPTCAEVNTILHGSGLAFTC